MTITDLTDLEASIDQLEAADRLGQHVGIEDPGKLANDLRPLIAAARERDELKPDIEPGLLSPADRDTFRMVRRFAAALADKLARAEIKYGHSNGWLTEDWEAEWRHHLVLHLAKGDPLDVAAYAAFGWARGWSTTSPGPDLLAALAHSERENERVSAEAASHGFWRIVEFFDKLGIGTGDDPIGFLLASHVYLAHQRDEAQREVAYRQEELKTSRAATLILYGDDHATQVYRDLWAERDEAIRQRDEARSALEDLQGAAQRAWEARTDAFNDFFNDHLTDGNDGYRDAATINRCRSAFNEVVDNPFKAATNAALAALNPNPEAKS